MRSRVIFVLTGLIGSTCFAGQADTGVPGLGEIKTTLQVLSCTSGNQDPTPEEDKARVIVSTDIGGSDPDDYQSMVHYLLYADRFDTEGLISSPPGTGRKEHILETIVAYEKDYACLVSHASGFPAPDDLRACTKQGSIMPSGADGYGEATEGSAWIIGRADAADARPLWILVWGSITDVAQAVHDAPRIKEKIRVYFIGSWNTSQDRTARNYLFEHHADLWLIENNATFRGMYVGGDQNGDLGNASFVEEHIRHHGTLGDFFFGKKGDIKMGDTPSVLYLLSGDPDQPASPHWGGQFRATDHGSHYWTDLSDAAYCEGRYEGAKTVNVWREEYLRDWQTRLDWIKTP